MFTTVPCIHFRWLFFDETNVRSAVHVIEVPSCSSEAYLKDLEWVDALIKRFGFWAKESTLEFWTMGSSSLDI
jgi:hypothetical protein